MITLPSGAQSFDYTVGRGLAPAADYVFTRANADPQRIGRNGIVMGTPKGGAMRALSVTEKAS